MKTFGWSVGLMVCVAMVFLGENKLNTSVDDLLQIAKNKNNDQHGLKITCPLFYSVIKTEANLRWGKSQKFTPFKFI